jgi:hypothetical protein
MFGSMESSRRSDAPVVGSYHIDEQSVCVETPGEARRCRTFARREDGSWDVRCTIVMRGRT